MVLLEPEPWVCVGSLLSRCEVCGFQCRQRASLKYHMTKHKAEADLDFECLMCRKRFEKAHNLNVHMSMVHPLVLAEVQRGAGSQQDQDRWPSRSASAVLRTLQNRPVEPAKRTQSRFSSVPLSFWRRFCRPTSPAGSSRCSSPPAFLTRTSAAPEASLFISFITSRLYACCQNSAINSFLWLKQLILICWRISMILHVLRFISSLITPFIDYVSLWDIWVSAVCRSISLEFKQQ